MYYHLLSLKTWLGVCAQEFMLLSLAFFKSCALLQNGCACTLPAWQMQAWTLWCDALCILWPGLCAELNSSILKLHASIKWCCCCYNFIKSHFPWNSSASLVAEVLFRKQLKFNIEEYLVGTNGTLALLMWMRGEATCRGIPYNTQEVRSHVLAEMCLCHKLEKCQLFHALRSPPPLLLTSWPVDGGKAITHPAG